MTETKAEYRQQTRQKIGYLMSGRFPRDGTSVIRLGPATRRAKWQRLVVSSDTDCAGCGHLIEKGTRAVIPAGERPVFRTLGPPPPCFHPACIKKIHRRRRKGQPRPAKRAHKAAATDSVLKALQSHGGWIEWESSDSAVMETHVSTQALMQALNSLQAGGRLTWTRLERGALIVALCGADEGTASSTPSGGDAWTAA